MTLFANLFRKCLNLFHRYSTRSKIIRTFASGSNFIDMAKREHNTRLASLAGTKNFRLPEDIVDGYGLYAKKGERKVTLIGRCLKSGNVALIRYSYEDGRKVQQSTGVVLVPETSGEIKAENRQKLEAEQAKCDQLNNELIAQDAGFQPKTKKSRKMLLTEYIKMVAAAPERSKSFHVCVNSLCNHLEAFRHGTKVADVDEAFVTDFAGYLKTEAINVHYKGNQPQIKTNTQVNILEKLRTICTIAMKEGLMMYNPFGRVMRGVVPKRETENRTYLTKAEVLRLMSTPYKDSGKYADNVPRAFLFSCFTGLRYSDVKALRWQKIGTDDNGSFIWFKAKKTGKDQKLYFGKMAAQFLPARAGDNDPEFNLPADSSANKMMLAWFKAAGITKHITFHCGRHTTATMLLNEGVPIETVSYQLGHANIATTQVYAKITGRTQKAAISKLDEAFEGIN